MIESLANWPGAVWLQNNWIAYLFVNAAHILSIGLLVGAILPLDLRLMGLFRRGPLTVLAPFLSWAAATGLGLAVITGVWLFSVKPDEYLANPAFRWKLGLLALAVGNAALQHMTRGYRRAVSGGHVGAGVKLRAVASVVLWLAALLAGRWVGFL